MEQLLEEIEARMVPFKEELDLLMTIPGIQLLTALTILSEVGIESPHVSLRQAFCLLDRRLFRQ